MNRNLKIEPIYQTRKKIFSRIRLEGKWLKDAGFNPNQRVNVEVKDGQLIITVIQPQQVFDNLNSLV